MKIVEVILVLFSVDYKHSQVLSTSEYTLNGEALYVQRTTIRSDKNFEVKRLDNLSPRYGCDLLTVFLLVFINIFRIRRNFESYCTLIIVIITIISIISLSCYKVTDIDWYYYYYRYY